MMFPKPMRLEPWVAFDGALAVDVVLSLAEPLDGQDQGDVRADGDSLDAGGNEAAVFASPMPFAATVESGINEIEGSFDNGQSNDLHYELDLPYGVEIPEDGEAFLPFYKDGDIELDNGLENDAHSLYFEVTDPENGTFDFYELGDTSSIKGLSYGDLLFVKGPNSGYLFLAQYIDYNGGQLSPILAVKGIVQQDFADGMRFTFFNSDPISTVHGQIIGAENQVELLLRSLVFKPNAGAEGSIGSFEVNIYYEKTDPVHAGSGQTPPVVDWSAVTDGENLVGKIEDGSVECDENGVIVVVTPPAPPDPPDPGTDPTDPTDPPVDPTDPGTTDPTDPTDPSTTDPGNSGTTEPTDPEPAPEPEPVPEPLPPIAPPSHGAGTDPGDSGSGSSSGDASSGSGGDSVGSGEAGDASGEGESGEGGGAEDLGYIQQRDADAEDEAAAASSIARREERDGEATPVAVEALPGDAASASVLELARDLENLLGSVLQDRTRMEEILLRLREEYLARPADDWGDARDVLRSLFDSGNAEMRAINRVIAELGRQMDDFHALSAVRRDGMVLESLRELASSVGWRSGETGAITQALSAVVDALSKARAAGEMVAPEAMTALYEETYNEGIAAWQAKAERDDQMGRELAAARELAVW